MRTLSPAALPTYKKEDIPPMNLSFINNLPVTSIRLEQFQATQRFQAICHTARRARDGKQRHNRGAVHGRAAGCGHGPSAAALERARTKQKSHPVQCLVSAHTSTPLRPIARVQTSTSRQPKERSRPQPAGVSKRSADDRAWRQWKHRCAGRQRGRLTFSHQHGAARCDEKESLDMMPASKTMLAAVATRHSSVLMVIDQEADQARLADQLQRT